MYSKTKKILSSLMLAIVLVCAFNINSVSANAATSYPSATGSHLDGVDLWVSVNAYPYTLRLYNIDDKSHSWAGANYSGGITCLQVCLNGLGYNLKPDGIWGTNTSNALYNFQVTHQLPGDRVCGGQTWRKINNCLPAYQNN